MELELINPDHEVHGKMHHNTSQKHESGFTSVTIQKNNSVMLSSLEGATLGVWISMEKENLCCHTRKRTIILLPNMPMKAIQQTLMALISILL